MKSLKKSVEYLFPQNCHWAVCQQFVGGNAEKTSGKQLKLYQNQLSLGKILQLIEQHNGELTWYSIARGMTYQEFLPLMDKLGEILRESEQTIDRKLNDLTEESDIESSDRSDENFIRNEK